MSFYFVQGGYWGFVNPQPVIIGQSFQPPGMEMDPRMREDDGTEARACAERTVIPVPASFLRRQESIPGI